MLAGLGALALLVLGLRTRWLAWPLAGDLGLVQAALTGGAGQRLYVQTGPNVLALDAQTGQELGTVPVQLAAQHISLAVHPTTHRLFVSDATFENRVAVLSLTAYRTAD
uniref:YncE family protein n=1 Tax=Thermorudis sp. TaxID=1969470 RepID=A0A7C2ZYM6_9BACT